MVRKNITSFYILTALLASTDYHLSTMRATLRASGSVDLVTDGIAQGWLSAGVGQAWLRTIIIIKTYIYAINHVTKDQQL